MTIRLHPLLITIILGRIIPFINGSERDSFNDAISTSSSLYVRRRDDAAPGRALQGVENGGTTCPNGGDSLQINIKFDSYPEDFELELKNDATKYAVWSRNDATHQYTADDQQSTVTTSACLPANGCWRLNVFDTKGDGLTFNSLPSGVGGGFRILFNDKTIDYYTGQFNGCFSTKWYRFGDACGGPGYVEYGYTLAPGCKDFSWDFSPSGILSGDLMDGQTVQDPTKPPPATKAPSGAPSAAPSAAPSDSPTIAPSETPVAAPTGAPVTALTPAPTFGPTDPPTLSPTNAPVPAPTTEAPVPEPTDSPVSTVAPTKAPTTAPVASNVTNYTQVGNGDECSNFTFSATIAEDPMDIAYKLERAGDNDTLWAVQQPFGEGNDAPGTSIVNSTCLDLAGCYTFTVRNRAYIATQGPQHGSFTLRLGGVILAQYHGMTDGCYRKKWYQFGEDCEFLTGTEPVGARRCGE